MAGRGRGRTLPAWMTDDAAPGSAPAAAPSTILSAPSPSSTSPPPAAASAAPNTNVTVAPPPQRAAPPGMMPGMGMPPRPMMNMMQAPPPGMQPGMMGMGMRPPGMMGPPPGFPGGMGMGMYPPMMGGAPGQHMMQPPWGGGQTDAQPQPQHQQGGGSQPMSIQQQLQQQSLLQQQQQASRSTAAAPSKAEDWTEYMHNGKPYFHNSKTNQTVWEKPFELLPLEERAALWKEYTAPQTGRKYYYNTSTKVTTWQEPAELKEVREKKAAAEPAVDDVAAAVVAPVATNLASAQAKADAAAEALRQALKAKQAASASSSSALSSPSSASTPSAQTPTSTPATQVPNSTSTPEPQQSASQNKKASAAASAAAAAELSKPKINWNSKTKPECVAAFKSLLTDLGIVGSDTFDAVLSRMTADDRFSALKSRAERESTFHEYTAKKKKEEQEEKRLQIKRTRDNFRALLAECTFINAETRLKDVKKEFGEDPRWKECDDADKEQLLEDRVSDMRREKKEADRKRKTELMEAFAKYLSATPWLGPETHWRNAEDKIRQEFPEYNVLVEIGADCRTVFEKACEDKRREVQEREVKEREAKKALARASRDRFREFLQEKKEQGVITAISRWKVLRVTWASEPAFKEMEASDAIRDAENLFEDLVDTLFDKYEDDRRTLKSLVKAAGISVKPDWDIERFKKMLAKTDGADAVIAKTQNVDMFFTELLERALEDSKRNLKKLERRLYDHLRRQTRHKLLSPDMPFEAVAAATSNHDTWKRLAEESADAGAVQRIVERWVLHEAKRQASGAGEDSGSSRSRSASRDRKGKAEDRHAPADRSRDRDDKGVAGSSRDVRGDRGRERRERSREARDRSRDRAKRPRSSER